MNGANVTNLRNELEGLTDRCIRIAFLDKETDILTPYFDSATSGTCINGDTGKYENTPLGSVSYGIQHFFQISPGDLIIADLRGVSPIMGYDSVETNAFYSAANENSFIGNFILEFNELNVIHPPANASYFRVTTYSLNGERIKFWKV